MKNTVTIITDDTLEINGKRFGVYKEVIGYNKNLTPLYHRFIQCAYDWNMSNPIRIQAKGLNQLVHKIENEQYRIAKG